jgi:PAS domain S-box-containing protein
MGQEPGKHAPFERAELLSVITEACDGADLAVLITLADTDPPRNLFLNQGAQKLLGCSEADFQAKSVWDWLAPGEAARIQALRERYLGIGSAAPRPFEATIQSGNGQRVDVEILQSRVTLRGQVLSVAFLFDISTRKATEVALRQSCEVWAERSACAAHPVQVQSSRSLCLPPASRYPKR